MIDKNFFEKKINYIFQEPFHIQTRNIKPHYKGE